MNYAYVVGIDAGFRNFAWCAVDNEDWRSPQQWNAEDLWPPRKGRSKVPDKTDCVNITVHWARRNKAMLDAADEIVLENQMRTPFIIINAVIQALYPEKTTVVHPTTVGAFWRLPRTRELKKEAGVEVVKKNGATLMRANGGKLDDLADAWLMAVYCLVQRGALRDISVAKK